MLIDHAVPLHLLADAMAVSRDRAEVCKKLEVTSDLLEEAIKHYSSQYGAFCYVGQYTIHFKPHFGIAIRLNPYDTTLAP